MTRVSCGTIVANGEWQDFGLKVTVPGDSPQGCFSNLLLMMAEHLFRCVHLR